MPNTETTILTEETVADYLANTAVGTGKVLLDSRLTGEAIADGNLNYTFCVTDHKTGKKLFVKQAPEYVANLGPDGLPLTSDRLRVELRAYAQWRQVLGVELYEKYLPHAFLFDTKNMVFAADFFEEFTLLDQALAGEEIVSSDIAMALGEFMGKIHKGCHISRVSDKVKERIEKGFVNEPMRAIQLENIFTKCYKEATDEQKAGWNADEAFMKEIELLKAAYNGTDKDNLTVCHGDLHPGSVMVKGSEVKVIDAEFAVLSSPGLDVGCLLSGYVLAAVHHTFSNNKEAVQSIIEGVDAIWSSYFSEMKGVKEITDEMMGEMGEIKEMEETEDDAADLAMFSKVEEVEGLTDEIMAKTEADAVGFAMAEVCRTALGFAPGRKWLQFEDADVEAKSKKVALMVVDKCMTKRHENGMELLLSTLGELTDMDPEKELGSSSCTVS